MEGEVDTDTEKDPPFAAAPDVIEIALVAEEDCMLVLVAHEEVDTDVVRDTTCEELVRLERVAVASPEVDGLPLSILESDIAEVDEILAMAERDAEDDGVSERVEREERDMRGLPVLVNETFAEEDCEASPDARPDADGEVVKVATSDSLADKVGLVVADADADALREILAEELPLLEELDVDRTVPLELMDGEDDCDVDSLEDREVDGDTDTRIVTERRGLRVVVPEIYNERAAVAERTFVIDDKPVSVPLSTDEVSRKDWDREADILPEEECEPNG
jgi:hypothetical protein